MSGESADAGRAIAELLAVMARLRDPVTGCPWDLAQSFTTIAPYTLEEAYEVADAIDSGDPEALRGELGDLLFQVVFHARMAEERGWFDFAQVAAGIAEKLTRRHPHVFSGTALALEAGDAGPARAATSPGDASSGPAPLDPAVDAALWRQWETQKEQERLAAARRRGQLASSVLQDVPRALPALVRAAKLGKRAARVGFDWESPAGVRDKVAEELRELDAAIERAAPAGAAADEQPHPQILEELGDLLFALANWGRHLRVDAETALRAANAKFERRFTYMERVARERGLELRALSAADWETLWGESKQAER